MEPERLTKHINLEEIEAHQGKDRAEVPKRLMDLSLEVVGDCYDDDKSCIS
jgi:hypothetical protein